MEQVMWLRLIIILLAIWLLGKLLKWHRSSAQPRESPPVANMVRCEYCGLFLPDTEALNSDQHFYCSEEHKSLAHR